jgi:hypothetical protein
MSVYMPVRYRRGVVGETQRSCHLVPTPSADAVPEFLIALCGQKFGSGTVDLLQLFTGMPCTQCVALAAAREAVGEISS